MDDVEATLARLEARLQALQAEIAAPPARAAPAERSMPRREAEVAPARTAPTADLDALEHFGHELRQTAGHLVEAYDRALARARGDADGPLFTEDLAMEVRADFPSLCTLHAALAQVPGVHAVDLRAYAGGHAALEIALDRPVALIAELRRTSPLPLSVLEARPGRLAVEVGAAQVP